MRLNEFFPTVLTESLEDLSRSNERWDKFSNDFPEFKRELESICKKYLGGDWKWFIEEGLKVNSGSVDQAIKKLWDRKFTDYEAVQEVGFWYDLAQNAADGGYVEGYQQTVLDPNDKLDNGQDSRPGRPVGVESGKLKFQ